MKRPVLLAVVFGIVLGPVVSSEAAIIFSTFGPGDSFAPNSYWGAGRDFTGRTWASAMAFSPTSTADLDRIEVPVAWFEGTNSIRVQLLEDNAGSPGDVLEAFALANLPSHDDTYFPTVLDSVLHPELVAGAQYWLTVLPGADDTFVGWNMSWPKVRGWLAGSFDVGVTWYPPSDARLAAFQIEGADVPEPISLIIWSVLGGFGVTFMSWRRKAARPHSGTGTT
jgi:hypothetical protein